MQKRHLIFAVQSNRKQLHKCNISANMNWNQYDMNWTEFNVALSLAS